MDSRFPAIVESAPKPAQNWRGLKYYCAIAQQLSLRRFGRICRPSPLNPAEILGFFEGDTFGRCVAFVALGWASTGMTGAN
jgi:hypothetical protein